MENILINMSKYNKEMKEYQANTEKIRALNFLELCKRENITLTDEMYEKLYAQAYAE